MPLTTNAMAWLEARNLDPEIATRYGVESYTTRSGEAIGFSYMLAGEHVNTKFRALGAKEFWMAPEGMLCLWNAPTLEDHTLRRSTPLIVTEGEIDALTAIQCGFPHVVSVPNGAPASDGGEAGKRYAWLDIHGRLMDHREIILAVDGDDAGARLRRDLEIRFGRSRCRWVQYPEGCKDLNDALQAHGADEVVRLLTTAPWCKIDGLYRLEDLPPEPDHEVMRTGMPQLDPHYKIRVGELTVISGIPNSGKTEWACALACSMAMKHGLRVAIGSFEDHARSSLVPRLTRWHRGVNATLGTLGDRHAAERWVGERFAFIVPDPDSEEPSDIRWLIERCKAAVIRHEARLVVVDPWNEIEHDKPDGMPLTEYIGHALRALKRFARNYDVHLIVVAHPSKAVAQKARDGQGMTAYDIADSAHWVNKPDAIIIIERDGDSSLTAVRVKKIRFQRDIGRPGTVHMAFNSELGRFEAAAAPEEIKS